MEEITNTTTMTDHDTTSAPDHMTRYHTRPGWFEVCCICGERIPIVYAPNGNPTDIGMHNPWPIMDTEAYGPCCEACGMRAYRANVAMTQGDAVTLARMAAANHGKWEPIAVARLLGMAAGAAFAKGNRPESDAELREG